MSTTEKFEPTHEISYREPPDAEPEVWLVALREDGTTIDKDGLSWWRVNDLGQWQHEERTLLHWPAAKLRVVNLTKLKKIKRGQEPKHMPAGTVITLTRQPDGSWRGYCAFNGLACKRTANGLMGLTSALCRAWLKETGIRTAKPSEAERPLKGKTAMSDDVLELASEEYPVGTFGTGCTANRIGVWKMMDGIENLHPGSGVDMSGHGANSVFFERVA